jgi:hypothetical protein
VLHSFRIVRWRPWQKYPNYSQYAEWGTRCSISELCQKLIYLAGENGVFAFGRYGWKEWKRSETKCKFREADLGIDWWDVGRGCVSIFVGGWGGERVPGNWILEVEVGTGIYWEWYKK